MHMRCILFIHVHKIFVILILTFIYIDMHSNNKHTEYKHKKIINNNFYNKKKTTISFCTSIQLN